MNDVKEQKNKRGLEEDQEAVAVTRQTFGNELKASLESEENAKMAVRRCVLKWWVGWACITSFLLVICCVILQ